MQKGRRDALFVIAIALPALLACKEIEKLNRKNEDPSLTPPAERPQSETLINEVMSVGAGSSTWRSFYIPRNQMIELAAQGVSHADKGFSVYVVDEAELSSVRSGRPFRHVPTLAATKTRAFVRHSPINSGQWYVVVMNTENIMNTMTVQVRVVSNPR